MSVQSFEYTKISELPAVNALTGTDVFIVNASGETSKISLTTLISIITAGVSGDISSLSNRLTTAEGNITDLSGTVNNIVTAGFNLIGIDTVSANTNGEGE